MRIASTCIFVAMLAAGAFLAHRPISEAMAAAGQTVAPATKPSEDFRKPTVAKWIARPYPKGEVNLLAMGDWGSSGKEQKVVAKGMAKYVDKVGTQFNGLLSLGDNFYVSLRNEDDYQFQSLFEDMYDAKSINFPFYASLGNHDYEKNKSKIEMAYAAKHPDSRWKLPARWYRVDLPAEAPLVTVLMLDSNKPAMSADDWLTQMKWIEEQLAMPKATKWTVACAHHPVFSNGAHGDNGVMQTHWGPLFKKYKLDFYLCGHDHDLQHLQIPDWYPTFLLVGGGGKGPTKMRRDIRGPFSKSLNGFAHLHFFEDHVEVNFINAAEGKTVHEFVRSKEGEVKIVVKGGNDKASTQPLKVLLGLDEYEKSKKDEEKSDTPPDP